MTPLLHALLSGEATPSDVQLVSVSAGDVVEITWRNRRDSAGESEHHPRLWHERRAALQHRRPDASAPARHVSPSPRRRLGHHAVRRRQSGRLDGALPLRVAHDEWHGILHCLPASVDHSVSASRHGALRSAALAACNQTVGDDYRWSSPARRQRHSGVFQCRDLACVDSAVRNGENTQTLSKDYAQAGIRQSSMPSARNSGAMDLRTWTRRSARTLSRR